MAEQEHIVSAYRPGEAEPSISIVAATAYEAVKIAARYRDYGWERAVVRRGGCDIYDSEWGWLVDPSSLLTMETAAPVTLGPRSRLSSLAGRSTSRLVA